MKLKTIAIILSIMLIFELALIAGQSLAKGHEPAITLSPSPPPVPVSTYTYNPISQPTPAEMPDPKPSYTPTLRSYEINKDHNIWHAQDPSSYITPNNEWVKYYAKKYTEYQNGILVPDNEMPIVQYRTDAELYPDNFNKDVWQNADYTLYTKQGDCEDITIAWVSIHRSKGHKAVVVAGELWFNDGSPNIKDFWYEYVDEGGNLNKKFVADTTQPKQFTAIPKYMFNDKTTWRAYDANWYN